MEYKIREYMDSLFESAPRTQRAYELKIELTQNLIEKYYAFVGEGKTQEDAFNLTVGSIGDVRELFAQLEDDENGQPVPQPVYYPQPQVNQKRVMCRVLAIVLFILSPVPAIIANELFGAEGLGVIGLFAMVAAGAGLLVYDRLTHPKPSQPVPGTVVEDFRQWQQVKVKKTHWRAAFNGAYWPLVVAFYFLLSFGTGKWYITWVVFLIAPAVGVIINTLRGAMTKQNGGK